MQLMVSFDTAVVHLTTFVRELRSINLIVSSQGNVHRF